MRAPAHIALMLVSTLAVGCTESAESPDSQVAVPELEAPSRTAHAVREEVPRSRSLHATVRSVHNISVAAESAGRVLRLHVDAGDHVRRGQVLAEIDAASLSSARQAARAAFQLADAERQRVQRLADQQAAAPRAIDESRNALVQARAQLRSADLAVRRSRVRAPQDGVVEERLVAAGDLAVPGRPLFRLYDAGLLWLEVHVPNRDVQHTQVGDAVSYELAGVRSDGIVAEVAPSSDPRSRTVRIRVALDAEGQTPGQYGTLSYNVGERTRIAIPLAAVEYVGQLAMLRVHESDGWHRRSVRLGRTDGEQVEVLAGLEGGEEVALP